MKNDFCEFLLYLLKKIKRKILVEKNDFFSRIGGLVARE